MKQLTILSLIGIWVCLLGCGGEETPTPTIVKDTVPPTIIATNVQGGPIPVNTPIVLVFSERVDVTSAQRGISVRSSIDAELVKGVIILQKNGREVKFTPTEQMTSGAYVLTVLGIEDTEGNVLMTPFSIFFGAVEVDTMQPPADVTPPNVVSSTPAEGQSVKSTGSLVVRFDEEVDVASVEAGIVVSGSEGTVEVNGAVAIFKPQKPMTVGKHTLVIVGIQDLAGNVMVSSLLIPFEVIAPPPEITPPPNIKPPPKGEGNVIYLDVADFIRGDSQFGVKVKGNTWIKVDDPAALGGDAFGGPGDNNYTADGGDPFLAAEPYLVIEFPQNVKKGESTADGKTWVPWARMRVPADQNSFYWQVSSDKTNWRPKIITNANRWNDDGQNGTNVWYWQDNLTGNDGAVNAEIAVGVNYLRVGVRESDPETYPLIDVACFRNDGRQPSDDEALLALSRVRLVEPAGKPVTSWGQIKANY